jgi:hypothetical protein
VRYWDKGGSEDEDAAYTAGCLMHNLLDKTYVIEHMARGRWLALEREQRIKAYARADQELCKSYEVRIEQEPGTGGRESAENTLRNLAGYRAHADRVTGDKRGRAQRLLRKCRPATYSWSLARGSMSSGMNVKNGHTAPTKTKWTLRLARSIGSPREKCSTRISHNGFSPMDAMYYFGITKLPVFELITEKYSSDRPVS